MEHVTISLLSTVIQRALAREPDPQTPTKRIPPLRFMFSQGVRLDSLELKPSFCDPGS